jgi:hypothetical protein
LLKTPRLPHHQRGAAQQRERKADLGGDQEAVPVSVATIGARPVAGFYQLVGVARETRTAGRRPMSSVHTIDAATAAANMRQLVCGATMNAPTLSGIDDVSACTPRA